MLRRTLMATALLASTALPTGLAIAAEPGKMDLTDLALMPPQQRIEFVKAQIKHQRRALTADATLDVSSPVLTAFHAAPAIYAARASSQVPIEFTVTDDLSGLKTVWFNAISPSGKQTSGVWTDTGFPTTQMIGRMALHLNGFAEPGVWTITNLGGVDAAGNYFQNDSAALSALGNNHFTVTNPNGGDIAAPTLVKGEILSPSVSLSQPSPGASSGFPFVGVKVVAADAGTDASLISGVAGAGVSFCLADHTHCFWTGASMNRYGLTHTSFNTRRQLDETFQAGDYYIEYVYLTDVAGNNVYMLSTQFGGTLDVSAFFPDSHISINL